MSVETEPTENRPIDFPFPEPPTLYHPNPELAELQSQCPVAKVQLPDGNSAWLVTRHADVRQVLIDPRFSRAAALAAGPDQGFAALAAESIIGMDPPHHTRLRKLVAGAFTVRRIDAMRPRVIALVNQLLAEVVALPQPVDLVEHFSLSLPVHVICELIGVPASDRETFHAWSDAVMGSNAKDPAVMLSAFRSLQDYFTDLIAAKRRLLAENPDLATDLMSALITVRDEDGDRLSEEELVGLGITLLIAGHETTANQINMILLTLREHPEQWRKLQYDPSTLPVAVEELMRFTQLGSGGAAMARVTTEPVELSGVTIPAGQAVLPALGAANRDPLVFEDPDCLRLDRAVNPHIGFGAGIHHCLGAQLARMELQEALAGMLRWLPGLAVAVPDDELDFKPSMIVRSLERLPVTWDAAA
jgi:cytochrome P450